MTRTDKALNIHNYVDECDVDDGVYLNWTAVAECDERVGRRENSAKKVKEISKANREFRHSQGK